MNDAEKIGNWSRCAAPIRRGITYEREQRSSHCKLEPIASFQVKPVVLMKPGLSMVGHQINRETDRCGAQDEQHVRDDINRIASAEQCPGRRGRALALDAKRYVGIKIGEFQFVVDVEQPGAKFW